MKIHSLEIENIASLKGQHKIDFDKLFSESSLFAITGKTGSGKSTILNCISLALYGSVYKKDSDGMDFVTLGEASGKIVLTFSNLGSKYQAQWSLKLRKKNGELYKKPQLQRNLAKSGTNQELEFLDAPIESVIGLTFDQFCKTTILNQGQFAKFLTSSFKERKDILEKFYQGIDLETLNIKLNEKIRLKKSTLEEAENQIKGHTQAFEHIEVSKEVVEEFQLQSQEATRRKTVLELCNSTFKDIQGCFKTIDENEARLTLSNKQLELDQNSFNSLKKHFDTISKQLSETEKILSTEKPLLQEGAKLFIEKNKHIEQVEYQIQRIKKYLESQKTLTETLDVIVKKNEAAKEQETKILTQFKILSHFPYKELRSLIDQFTKLSSDQEKNCELLEIALKQLTEFKNEKKDLNESLADLNKKLSEEKTRDLDVNLQKYRVQSQKTIRFKDFIERYSSAVKNLKSEIKTISTKAESKGVSLEDFEKEKEKLQTEISVSDKAYKYFSLSIAIHTCREESQTKGTCVVCNQELSKSIELEDETDNQEMIAIENRLNDQQQELNLLTDKISKTKLEKLALTGKVESLTDDLKQWKANAIIEGQKVSDLNLGDKNTLSEIENTLLKITNEEESLQSAQLNFSKMLTRFESSNIELTKVTARVNQLEIRHGEITKTIEDLQAELRELSTKLGVKLEDPKEIQTIKKASEQYESITEAKKLFQNDIKNTSNNLDQTKIEIASVNSEVDANKKQIERINQFLIKNLGSEKDPSIRLSQLEEGLINQKNEALENSKELSKVEVKLAEHKSKTNNFKDQIRESKLLIESLKEKLRLKLLELEETEKNSDGQSSDILRLLSNLSQLDSEDESISPLLQETQNYLTEVLEQAVKLARDAQKVFTETSNDLARKLENEKKVATLAKQTNSIKNELDKLSNLYELIGKDEFRNFILSLIETTLIDQTNRELESLYQGRYSIIQTHKKNRAISEFKILDYFRDGLSRKVSTLSGGETFLVSLAMALALAELTRGTTQIDSLFIDEGFGTLDQDSIDEVFELLEKIQHSGKQIGIISHVQSLTSRIGLNINLEKNTDGVSIIDIVYN